MKNIIGISNKKEPNEAINEATNSIINPKLLIFFTSYESLQIQSNILKDKYPTSKIVGTIATNFYNGKNQNDNLTVIAFFDDVEVETGIINNLSSMPLNCIKDLENNIKKINPQKDNTVLIEFCTGHEEKLISTIGAIIHSKSIGLIGGTVFGYPDGQSPKVCMNGILYEDSCVYVLIKNKTGKIHILKENIYGKNNSNYHVVTKVNRSEKELIELDSKPAAQVFSNELGIPKDKIADSVLEHPIGRIVGNEIYVASMCINGVTSYGSIKNYKQLNKNDRIYFLRLLDYKKISDDTINTIKNNCNNISLVFSIDCIYRYILFNNKNYLTTYLDKMHSLGNHVGIVSGGEQFNNQHVNQTMVCAIFE